MACFEHGTVVALAARDVVTLPDLRSATLRVTRGTLWITQEGDPQDVVLRAGDNWAVERDGLTVVEAQEHAIFCISGRRFESATPRRRAPAAPAWQRARRGLAAFFALSRRGPVPYY